MYINRRGGPKISRAGGRSVYRTSGPFFSYKAVFPQRQAPDGRDNFRIGFACLVTSVPDRRIEGAFAPSFKMEGVAPLR
jgi:hypothetical protein